ncbi:MAG: FAD:protein FMN transferase [Candidatus Margulisbacteria bacterium]|nr:FAD:protein FMN transferase [Candidatus Margulisiibacteriota bacterium]
MKVRLLYLFLVFVLVLVAGQQIYARLNVSAEKTAYIMGSPVRVKVQGPGAGQLARLGLEEVERLDQLLSSLKPASEVSTVNKFAGQEPVAVSGDTFDCVRLAQIINCLSWGAFDITLGSPSVLVLDHRLIKIFLKKNGAKINLGGIGKGYAAEAVRQLLLKKGAKSGMIDMRSSIAVFGLPAGRQDQRSWQIGIQHPREKDKLIGTVTLTHGQSLATSGDYERGQHIVDPRTSKPAKLCQGVTIVGRNAAETDALSTAVFVLGPARGLELVETLAGTEALIVDQQGKISQSSGFVLNKK